MNGSGHDIDTVLPDNFRYFELLAMLVDEESAELFDPLERSMMQSIGIEKGSPLTSTQALLPDRRSAALRRDGLRVPPSMRPSPNVSAQALP